MIDDLLKSDNRYIDYQFYQCPKVNKGCPSKSWRKLQTISEQWMTDYC